MPYNWGQTWYSSHHPQALLESIKGIHLSLANSIWEQPIREAINWYADAISFNATSIGSLIWCQTALELIAWTYLTQDTTTKKMTENDFDRKITPGAAQKLSMLLDEIGIDKAIPGRYLALQKFAVNLSASNTSGIINLPQNDPLDGPSLITHVRNMFVHPKNHLKRSILPNEAQYEAKALALEYLEFAILKILDVNSSVVHRSAGIGPRSAHQVEPLPWLSSIGNNP